MVDQNLQRPNRDLESPGNGEPALSGEVIDSRGYGGGQGWGEGNPFGRREGIGGALFGPRSFGGGRVQVYGCSPGCIILSLVVSLILSIVLTLLLNAIL